MDEYYNTDVVEYFLSELDTNKILGLVSARQTGKTIIGLILLVEKVIRTRKDGIFYTDNRSLTTHIMDKIVHILTQYGIQYNISSDKRLIAFMGLKIKWSYFRNFVEEPIISSCGYSIVYFDDPFTNNKVHYIYIDALIDHVDYVIFSDIKCELNKYRLIDNSKITSMVLRRLKIEKLLSNG